MKILKFFILCIVLLIISSCNRNSSKNDPGKYDLDNVLNKNDPITIDVWHYYSASQKEKFDRLVDNFNASEGAKYGVYVRSIRRAGNVNEISSFL